jgi:Bacterial protein of unknown function (DUF948)
VSAGQIAALIAAGFFAVGMCAVVFVLLRLAGLISHAHRLLTDYGDRADAVIERAQAAVNRTNEQLARTDSITANMDDVTANMADLSGHVSALAGLARSISAGFGTPLLRISAFAFGLRRAVALRRPDRVTATALRDPEWAPSRDAVGGARNALPAPPPAARTRRALPRQRGAARRRQETRR